MGRSRSQRVHPRTETAQLFATTPPPSITSSTLQNTKKSQEFKQQQQQEINHTHQGHLLNIARQTHASVQKSAE